MKNPSKHSFVAILLTACALASATTAQAGTLEDRQIAIGFQSSGPSVKMPLNEDYTGQLVIGALGTVTAIELRGLKNIAGNETVDYYGYGSVGVWTWGGGSGYRSETVFGAGLGIGVEYDIRKSVPDMPPLFFSAEIGASFVSFSNYNSFNALGIGLGVHYQF